MNPGKPGLADLLPVADFPGYDGDTSHCQEEQGAAWFRKFGCRCRALGAIVTHHRRGAAWATDIVGLDAGGQGEKESNC
jgi:hypothetical protein